MKRMRALLRPRVASRRARGSGSRPASARRGSRIMRESVVLPLPDSPTMVKISGRPAEIAKLTSSTARKAAPPKRPPTRIGLGDAFDREEVVAHSGRLRRLRLWQRASPRGSRRSRRRGGPARASSAPAPRGGRCPWRAGSADGSGSRAAARKGSAARRRAPSSAPTSPIRGRLSIRCAV